MNKRPGYSPEVRERAVRMVLTGEHEHRSRWAAVQSVAAKIGCTPQTLLTWINKMEVDSGIKPGVTSDQAARMKELEREKGGSNVQTRFCARPQLFLPRRSSTANRSFSGLY